MKKAALYLLPLVFFISCKKEDVVTPSNNGVDSTSKYNLIFKFKFDSTQERLGNLGQPAGMPAGNAGQSPVFNVMSAHYIELAPDQWTALGKGAVLYKAAETNAGGASAIDFAQAKAVGDGQVFYSVPLKNVPAGDYSWLRVSLAYQNYDVKFWVDTTISGFPIRQYGTATVASFIGFNTYIGTFNIKNAGMTVNGNRKQGFWATESSFTFGGITQSRTDSGQSAGTTVVNPISATSPIPAGSCVVTGQILPGKLTITGKETKDVVVEVALSTNKSFEWKEVVANGRWDVLKGEQVVDMGIRGMKPTIQ